MDPIRSRLSLSLFSFSFILSLTPPIIPRSPSLSTSTSTDGPKLISTVTFLAWLGVLESHKEAVRLQNFLICAEMVVAAVLHHRAFTASEVGEHADDDPLLPTIAVQRVFDSHDVVDDVKDAFGQRFGTEITGLDRRPIEMKDRSSGKAAKAGNESGAAHEPYHDVVKGNGARQGRQELEAGNLESDGGSGSGGGGGGGGDLQDEDALEADLRDLEDELDQYYG